MSRSWEWAAVKARCRASMLAAKREIRMARPWHYGRDIEQQPKRPVERRDDRIVIKQHENARVPAPVVDDPGPLKVIVAPIDWDHQEQAIAGAIATERGVMEELLGHVIARLQREFGATLDERDRKIEHLEREVKYLRSEFDLEHKLISLKTEISQARQQAPNFRAELSALRKQAAEQKTIISKLRAEASALRFAQEKSNEEITRSRVRVTAEIGSATREVLEKLREDFDLTA